VNEEVSRDMTGEADRMNQGVLLTVGLIVRLQQLTSDVICHTSDFTIITDFDSINYKLYAASHR